MLTPNPVQTTYTQYISAAQNGMLAASTGWDIDTKITEDISGNGIGFGLAVSQSYVNDRGVVLGNLSGFNFVGITCADPTLPNLDSGAGGIPFTDKYQNGDNTAVLPRGDLWVVVGDTVVAGNPVYYNSVTGQLGASGISNATEILGARWMTSASSAGLAVVRLTGAPAH
jgi:hypothetical protein